MEKSQKPSSTQSQKVSPPAFATILLTGLSSIRWAFNLVEWYDIPNRGLGTVIALGMFFCFMVVVVLTDYLFGRTGVHRSIRSGVWASAVIGPSAVFEAIREWGYSTWNLVLGFASAVLAFGVFYFLEKFLDRKGRITTAAPDWASGDDSNCSAPATVTNGDRHTPDPPSR